MVVGAGSVVGCTNGSGATSGDDGSPRAARSLDPDVALAAEVLDRVQRHLDLVAATQGRHPSLAPSLRPALDSHRRHVALLGDAVPPEVAASPSPSPSASPSPGSASVAPGPVDAVVPPEPRAALRRLISGERELTAGLRDGSVRARSGPFARVLGVMAASAAQHAAALAASAAPGALR